MKLAANLSLLFTELPLPERVMAARIAGFEAVEIQFPYEVPAVLLKERLAQAGLPLVLINVPAADLLSGGPGLACVPSRKAALDQALEDALAYAAMVRPEKVNVLAGRLVDGLNRDLALDCLVGNLQKAAQAFAYLGIELVTEAINPIDMPGFLINTPEHLLELIKAVDHPNLKAQLDLYHMARQGLEIDKVCQTLAGHIGHVQFADCPGRGAPGSGALDFAHAFKCLAQVGYDDWLAAEYIPAQPNTEAGLSWLKAWQSQGLN